MKKQILSSIISICILFTMVALVYAQGSDPGAGNSPSNPAPMGQTVSDIISCGSGYDSHETYDIKITPLEAIRGDEALKRIRSAQPVNEAPEAGFEYVLVRIRFAFLARGKPGDCVFELTDEEFSAVSADGKEYKTRSVVPPDPSFFGKTVSSGNHVEGWAAFQVAENDSKPLLTFRGVIWFRLN